MRREQTPLEILNRDHNWKQGSLKRLLENIKIIRSPEDYATALLCVLGEIKRTRQEFEAAKQELLKK